jgi:cytoskeleton protein RodZ
VTDDNSEQLDAFLTPGTLLKAAREAQGLSEREVADRLHLMPGYPAIIERDEYTALLHPAFARGYVKAYGKLVGVDENSLLNAFDRLRAEAAAPEPRKVRTRPLQLQHTGLAVVIGLVLLLLLVLAIWWWRGEPVAPGGAVVVPTTDLNHFATGDR